MIEMSCPTCGKALRIPDEYAGVLGKCNGCGDPVQVPGIPRLDGPATVQPPALSSSDLSGAEVTPSGTFTRNESIGIDMAVSQREMARAHKDMADSLRKQVMFGKATCGCLLLTLTAPIWIAIIVFVSTVGFTAAVGTIATFFGMVRPVTSTPDPLPVVIVEAPPADAATAADQPDAEIAPEPLPLTKAVFTAGAQYHLVRVCDAMTQPPGATTLGVALERGKQPCPLCAPDEPPNEIAAAEEAPAEETPTPDPIAAQASISVPPATDSPAGEAHANVYVGPVDQKYHELGCGFLRNKGKSIPLSKALEKGFTACATCKPPK